MHASRRARVFSILRAVIGGKVCSACTAAWTGVLVSENKDMVGGQAREGSGSRLGLLECAVWAPPAGTRQCYGAWVISSTARCGASLMVRRLRLQIALWHIWNVLRPFEERTRRRVHTAAVIHLWGFGYISKVRTETQR